MIMTPGLRKSALIAHIISAHCWHVATAGFLALSIAGLTSQDEGLVRRAYLAMDAIGCYAFVPLCVACLVTGVVVSLGTPWGLIRYNWALLKLLINIILAIILFMHMQTLSHLGHLAASTTVSIDNLRNPSPILVATATLLGLLVSTILSMSKPPSMSQYRQHEQQEHPTVSRL